ncbi:MAG: leucyl/phenylalanyl-tRNA--protein transferase [Lentisphaeria bacterium]|nr:leucyl/phenylalanyl-tRNA--protein transferase [Lentisphaeria bacterium]
MADESIFPPPDMADENGIVAVSREIHPGMLIDAYSHGIFPWPFGDEYDFIPWCAPLERGVIPIEEFHIPSSFLRKMKKLDFSLRVDHDFPAVIKACAAAERPEQEGTWITAQIIDAYCRFHKMGYAHSFETYDSSGNLVGGLYGISVGRIFCGESMFYKVSGASKFAFVKMAEILKTLGVVLIDTQMVTNATASFGAREIPSAEYICLLKKYGGKPLNFSDFTADCLE